MRSLVLGARSLSEGTADAQRMETRKADNIMEEGNSCGSAERNRQTRRRQAGESTLLAGGPGENQNNGTKQAFKRISRKLPRKNISYQLTFSKSILGVREN